MSPARRIISACALAALLSLERGLSEQRLLELKPASAPREADGRGRG